MEPCFPSPTAPMYEYAYGVCIVRFPCMLYPSLWESSGALLLEFSMHRCFTCSVTKSSPLCVRLDSELKTPYIAWLWQSLFEVLLPPSHMERKEEETRSKIFWACTEERGNSYHMYMFCENVKFTLGGGGEPRSECSLAQFLFFRNWSELFSWHKIQLFYVIKMPVMIGHVSEI